MTIAACYLSAEGVVLGADSTSTMFVAGRGEQPGSEHQYNFAETVPETVPAGNGACHHLETYRLGGQGVMAAAVISVRVRERSRNVAPSGLAVLLASCSQGVALGYLISPLRG